MVSCFLTPSTESQYTYPPLLAREVEQVVGEYLFDCTNFRTDDKDDLLAQVYEMTDRRFRLADHLLRTRSPGSSSRWWRWGSTGCTTRSGRRTGDTPTRSSTTTATSTASSAGCSSTPTTTRSVLVVSDHGAKRLEGGIRINEWLRREGLLRLAAEPDGRSSLAEVGVDWAATTAWGDGGYYGRVFLNVRGREPQGTVAPEDYERVRAELAERLAAIPGARRRAARHARVPARRTSTTRSTASRPT